MTARWPYTALRAPLPHATPERAAGVGAKPFKSSLIHSSIPARNTLRTVLRCTLRNTSRVIVAVIRSLNSLRKSSRTKFFDVHAAASGCRLTCANINGSHESRKGVAVTANGRYRSTDPRVAPCVQESNTVPLHTRTPEAMPIPARGGDSRWH